MHRRVIFSYKMMAIFLFADTWLVKKFQFKAPDDRQLPLTLEPNRGFTLTYKGFKAAAISR